jgi:rhodanese-related sulfurtransferase
MLEQIIKEGKCSIVDVRTREEFSMQSVNGTVNIPLQELEMHLDELKGMQQPIVLCCASGTRSGMANMILNQKGLQSYNAGPWFFVQSVLSSK